MSEATLANTSKQAAKTENDSLISEVLDSDMAAAASNIYQDGGDISTCTASNLQTIHSLTKRLCEVDDFDEVFSHCVTCIQSTPLSLLHL